MNIYYEPQAGVMNNNYVPPLTMYNNLKQKTYTMTKHHELYQLP